MKGGIVVLAYIGHCEKWRWGGNALFVRGEFRIIKRESSIVEVDVWFDIQGGEQ